MIHLLATLAVWRVASLVTYERGPYAIFEKLRHVAGIRPGELPTTEIGKGLQCMWCNSMWWATLVAFGLFLTTRLSMVEGVLSALAYSAGAILIEELRVWLEQNITPS